MEAIYDCLNMQVLKDMQDDVDHAGLGLIGMQAEESFQKNEDKELILKLKPDCLNCRGTSLKDKS